VINGNENNYFDALEYNIETVNLDMKDVEIKTLTETQLNIINNSIKVQKIIEKTKDEKHVRIGRGDIEFNWENPAITSWSNTTEIEMASETTIKFKDLDMTFDLQEGIKLANLINRFKYNHP
jgi:hypothetical protein